MIEVCRYSDDAVCTGEKCVMFGKCSICPGQCEKLNAIYDQDLTVKQYADLTTKTCEECKN